MENDACYCLLQRSATKSIRKKCICLHISIICYENLRSILIYFIFKMINQFEEKQNQVFNLKYKNCNRSIFDYLIKWYNIK